MEDKNINKNISAAEDEFWNENEPVMKSGKKNIIRFIFIKIITIIFIGYIGAGYLSDISYFFNSEKITPLGEITIDTYEAVKIDDWLKKHDKYVSVSGWVEIERSFAVKIGFSKYDVLKLWRLPVFIAVKHGDPGVDKSLVSTGIPYLDISGRLSEYKKLAKKTLVFNPYLSIATAYRVTTKEKLPDNAIVIMANEKPYKDYIPLVIMGIILLYVLYSIYGLFKIFKETLLTKEEKNDKTN